MRDFATVLFGTLLFCSVLLFFGGMVAAALEIRAEKRAGLPVTRPGWRRADREAHPKYLAKTKHKLPRGTAFVVWPLVAVGRPDLAERYLSSRKASA